MTGNPRARRPGELVGGKYKLVRLMAQGGMGVVYEAQHVVVKRRFALKLLRPDLAERRDFLERFRREAEAAGALENEHVAAAVDFGVTVDGAPYIVMEHLVGESLGTLLEREAPLSPGRAAELIRQACQGVQAAHAAGIVHRDLKPHNLFVCRQDGTDLVKVLDFGVAKLQGADQANAATGTGAALGTVPYMSPEQARGDTVVDRPTDVYALGAILYELLSGKRPHPGDSHNAILHHIGTQPAVPLALARSGLPAELVALVERTLSSDLAVRPASAETLGTALAAWARREVWPAAPSVDAAPAAASAGAADAAPSPAVVTSLASGDSENLVAAALRAPAAPVPTRGRRALLVLGAAALAIAGIAIVAAQRPPLSPPQAMAGHAPPPPPSAPRAAPPQSTAISPGPRPSATEAATEVAEIRPSWPLEPGGRSAGRPAGRPPAAGRPLGAHAPRPAAAKRPGARLSPAASGALPAAPTPAPTSGSGAGTRQAAAPAFDAENPYDRR